MVCDNGIHASGGTMEATDGVPASASQAKWSSVGCHLEHCPSCGAFVSPRTGVCNNPGCGQYGDQVAETMEWPPKGVRFTTDKSKFGEPVTIEVPNDGDAEQQAVTAETGSAQQDEAQARAAQPTSVSTMTDKPPLVDGLPPDSDGEPVAQPASEAVPVAQPAQPQPSPQMAAFQQMQTKAREDPVDLKPLGEDEEDEFAAKQREVEEARDALVDAHGTNVLYSNGVVKKKYRDLPLARAYEQVRFELEMLQTDIGVDLSVDQSDDPTVVDNDDYWSTYEYGDSSKNGTVQNLPCSLNTYIVGDQWENVVAGAHTPVAADLLMHNSGEGYEHHVNNLTLWHGSEFNQTHYKNSSPPPKCPNCGKFVSLDKPRCFHCGHTGAFAAVYDRSTGESACFVEGCPGNVHGEPCPHQVGAMAASVLRNEWPSQLTGQLADNLFRHKQEGLPQTAATAAKDICEMLKKNGPDTMTFGSADVAERAQEVFEPRTNVGGAEKMKQDAQERIRRVLGNPEPPVPSRSPRDAAEHDPSFVMAEETEDIMRTIGAAIRVGYSPNSKGMAGRTFGLYGPPGTGKNAMLQEAAATMELPYREIDLGEGVDFQAMIGEVVLEADGKGGTRSVAKLGPLGQALVDGEVIALNEIIHTRGDAQTVLNQIAQDGEIQLHATEGARKKTYKVHPSSVLALTWNPKGGKQNRPIESLSSRIFSSRRVDYPTPEEESRRLHSWAEGMGLPNVDEESTRRTVDMLHDLRELYIQRGIEAPPTFRAGQSFLSMWKMTNDINQGVEQLRIFTNQLEDHDMQWRDVTNLVERHFGHLMD